jgi:L-alanine-DL-glutamate epimerase-like enolase superfamily enzyme
MKPTDIQIADCSCSTQQFNYRSPMKFGGRVVNDVALLNVSVTVKTKNGQTAAGFGSMPMGNIWAWPAGKTDPQDAFGTMIRFGKEVVEAAASFKDFGHPLELMTDFAASYPSIAASVVPTGNEPIPKLAQLVCASPLEGAVYDAYGRLLKANSYNVLSDEFCNRDLSSYLGSEFKGEYLDRYTLREPKSRMPLYHLVGALDPLTEEDWKSGGGQPPDDGLPKTFAQWIPYNGLTHIKIKLNGDNLDWDVNRVISVNKIAEEEQQKRNCKEWFYSADFNERCANVEYVLGFLQKVKEQSPAAFERLQYIEQPTHRDLKAHPENKMHKAAAIKPVVIDESLVDFESLQLSREMGYSGVALKACKGQSEALLMGAAAQKYKMFLCVQDLTCVGASFLHSATLSARIPTIAAIEGNGRQYCPKANAGWDKKYPSMFVIKDGTLGTSVLNENGLGFSQNF